MAVHFKDLKWVKNCFAHNSPVVNLVIEWCVFVNNEKHSAGKKRTGDGWANACTLCNVRASRGPGVCVSV